METFKRIRKFVFAEYLIVLAILVLFCSFTSLSWWWVVGYVIFPFVFILYALLIVCLFTLIGDGLKAKNPPACENCIWNDARKVSGHCLGEAVGKTFGTPCEHYERKEVL